MLLSHSLVIGVESNADCIMECKKKLEAIDSESTYELIQASYYEKNQWKTLIPLIQSKS
jgi:hypothetical protein